MACLFIPEAQLPTRKTKTNFLYSVYYNQGTAEIGLVSTNQFIAGQRAIRDSYRKDGYDYIGSAYVYDIEENSIRHEVASHLTKLGYNVQLWFF